MKRGMKRMEDWQSKFKMYMGLYWKNKFKVDKWAAIYIFAIFGIVVYNYNFPQPPSPPTPGMRMEEVLDKEYSLLGTLPGTTKRTYVISHKRNQASIQGSYSTDKSFSVIRDFYIEEAKKNGWTFVKEEYLSTDSSDHIMFRKYNPKTSAYDLSIYYFRSKGLFTVDLIWWGE